MRSEIRKDYFLNKYVIITPGRAKRPKSITAKTTFTKSEPCQFCPQGIEKDLIIESYQGLRKKHPWSVMVLKNKYPVVALNNPQSYGQHELVIETPNHGKELSQLSIKEIANLLQVFQDRTEKLSQIPKIDYVLIFKNKGGKSGASLSHAHCQIFASKLLPPDLSEEFLAMHQYQLKYHHCPYCDIIKKEQRSPRRIYADDYIVAFAPYASAYHYESWIFPTQHIDNITNLSQKQIKVLARVLKGILQKICQLDLSYNFFLHQVISEKNQHFYLKIQPRESIWGGIELGSGLIVNSLSPEKAAKYLRSKL